MTINFDLIWNHLQNLLIEINSEKKIIKHHFILELNTPLLGSKDGMDSISFVAFIIKVENHFSDIFKKDLDLSSDLAFSQKNSPFKNLQTLCEFIQLKLNE